MIEICMKGFQSRHLFWGREEGKARFFWIKDIPITTLFTPVKVQIESCCQKKTPELKIYLNTLTNQKPKLSLRDIVYSQPNNSDNTPNSKPEIQINLSSIYLITLLRKQKRRSTSKIKYKFKKSRKLSEGSTMGTVP